MVLVQNFVSSAFAQMNTVQNSSWSPSEVWSIVPPFYA